MKDSESSIEVGTPLYLVTSSHRCWQCHRPQSVICLATYSLRDEHVDTLGNDAEDGAPFLLMNIVEMPEAVSQYLDARYPSYQKHFSRTANVAYYANLCECGANFGDFYLHEPDGAFSPMSEDAAAEMTVSQLPFEGLFEFTCGWSQGAGELIFRHARRV